MKTNMGTTDRMLRIALSIIIIALIISVNFSIQIKTILFIISIFFVLTSIFGFCPIYRIFNFNTRKIDPLDRRR